MVKTKCVFAIFVLLQQLESVASQSQWIKWDVDPRCPDDERRLLQGPNDFEDPNEPPPDSITKEEAKRRELAIVGTTNPVSFNMKLYWRPGYCWQQEWEEREWCLECYGGTCDEEDPLWIKACDQYDIRQRFEWVQLGIDPTTYQNTGQLKVAGKDLCVEQVEDGKFRLQGCDSTVVDQMFVGFHIANPFQMRPFHVDHITECLTQEHHPKPYEELISEPCYVAQKHRTAYWNVYKPSETLVTLRFPACSASLPCDECQGDCTEDKDCLGSLRCYQRGFDNPSARIPGCAGVPLAHYADYCYDPFRK